MASLVQRFLFLIAAVVLFVMIEPKSGIAQKAPPFDGPPDSRTLDERLRDLKDETLQLNRDLSILQEGLHSPGNTMLTIYLALDASDQFLLDSVTVLVDNQIVAGDLYDPGQVSALRRGGIRKLYAGSIVSGVHQFEARLVGLRAGGTTVRKSAIISLEKGKSPKTILLTITDIAGKSEPIIKFESRD